MITFQLFLEGLLQRVVRVRDGEVQRKYITRRPYKMQDGHAVAMEPQERKIREKAAKLAAKLRRNKQEQANRKRQKSLKVRELRKVEKQNEVNH